MSDWISVKDKLPEEEIKECIIYTTNSNVTFCKWCHGHWLDNNGYFWLDNYVTHWMPLPEPPKE